MSFVDPAVLGGLGSGDRFDTAAHLGRIRVPTLLVHGETELGGIVSEGGAERAASAMGDLTAVRIDGIGHDIHWRRVAEFRSVVIDFLESLERQPGP